MKIGILFTSLAVSFFAFSCGTIFTGSSDDISIKSTPSNAKISVVNDKGTLVSSGKTPMNINLSKKYDYAITIDLEGYTKQTVNVSSSLNALWLIADIFCGGLIAIVVDAITAGWNDLEPSSINVSLQMAYNENYEETLFTVYTMRDEEGTLRQWKVPMLRTN